MITRMDIVIEARQWLLTKWMHQAHLKQVGCDCGGLIRGVMIELGLMPRDVSLWKNAQKYTGYSANADGNSLVEACEEFLTRIPNGTERQGDVVVLAGEGAPQHMGILTDYRYGGFSIIHACNLPASMRVIETRLVLDKKRMRQVASFSIPGVV